mmetsp:Transcript_4245/g.6541  ORF Transcript_4245/g.6541 Transcript_4245/m.6541 type:complete len:297 (+) Transcript_4245:80-970(+)
MTVYPHLICLVVLGTLAANIYALRFDFDNVYKASPNSRVVSNGKFNILLWSHGRSASTTLSFSAAESLGMSFRGRPETFSSARLTTDSFTKCFDTDASLFVQVKPTQPGSESFCGTNFSELECVQRLMRLAKKTGIDLVVVNRRQNLLETLVSAFELTHNLFRLQNFTLNELIEHFLQLEVGFVEAKILGMPIVELDFIDSAYFTCNAVNKIAAGLAKIGFSLNHTCQTHTKQVTVSSDLLHESFEKRLPPEVYKRVVAELTGTPFEWMLDSNSHTWPASIQNPCSNIVNCLPYKG